MNPERAAAFVRTYTRLMRPPQVPELRLHLAEDAFGLWKRTEKEVGHPGVPPPYWAFAWPGGQALARYLLDHPAVVLGRSVFDLGSGSGLVAIAAARAGAAAVTAGDVDAFAVAAIDLNAEANEVSVTCSLGEDWSAASHASRRDDESAKSASSERSRATSRFAAPSLRISSARLLTRIRRSHAAF